MMFWLHHHGFDQAVFPVMCFSVTRTYSYRYEYVTYRNVRTVTVRTVLYQVCIMRRHDEERGEMRTRGVQFSMKRGHLFHPLRHISFLVSVCPAPLLYSTYLVRTCTVYSTYIVQRNFATWKSSRVSRLFQESTRP
jgi:hypothetical protein